MQRVLALISQNTFLKNSLILFSGTMVVNVLNYVFHLAIGRLVSPTAYGEIESLISLLAIITVPAATLTLIATKYAANLKASQNVSGLRSLSRYLNRKVIIYGGPIFILVLILTPWVKDFLNIKESLPVIFLWGVMSFSFLSAVTVGVLIGWQRFSDVNRIGVSSTILKLIGAVALIQLGYGVSGVAGSLILAAVLGYVISLYLLRKLLLPTPDEKENIEAPEPFSSLKQYILPAFYGTLAMAILGNADMIFAKHHLDPVVSGDYGALSVVAKTIFFVTGVLTTVLFAMSAEESGRGKSAYRTFGLAFLLTAAVASGSTLFFWLFPEFVMQIFFGAKYLHVSPLLGWFALSAGIYSLGNLMLQYLLSIHETKTALFFLALSLLEIPLLFFFGVGLYAIIGITIVTQIMAVLLGFSFILKKKDHVQARLDSDPGLQ